MFNQNIIEDPKIRWFVLNIDEDEFRRKQKGINTNKKSPKKYTGIIPDQESITIVDTSPTQTKPSIVATARNTIEQEPNEDNILNPDFLTKPKVF